MQDFRSIGSPASLITTRDFEGIVYFFLSYWSFEMTTCNEIALDGGDCQPNR